MADADPIGQKADDELACQARAGSPRSFEELARRYGVSYPTVRNRLDALIERVGQLAPEAQQEE